MRLIDADALYETLCHVWDRSDSEEFEQAVFKVIANAPTADRPTGEWIEVDSFESEKHSVTDMRCSLCGKYASMVLPHRTRCVYDFCPNCGAKMGGDD